MSNRREFAKKVLTQRAKTEKPLIETDRAVVIKDAYPKAQCHFIVVSKEDIPNVTAVRHLIYTYIHISMLYGFVLMHLPHCS